MKYCLVDVNDGYIMDERAVYNNECAVMAENVVATSDDIFELVAEANARFKKVTFDVSCVHIGRIKVVQMSMNVMDCVCICPHCGSRIRYGDMMMTNGIHNCSNCNLELNMQTEADLESDYEEYSRKMTNDEYEPYRYKDGDYYES